MTRVAALLALALALALSLVVVAAACALPFPEPPAGATLTCDDDAACPPGQSCHPVLKECFEEPPECATATELLADGTACALAGESDGICRAGLCTASTCGDGFVDLVVAAEECDDGNDVDVDECTRACRLARCGDGVVKAGAEQCDDGNDVDTDECTSACTLARCGDNVVATGVEQCDDGNDVDTDGCTSACTLSRCGDGFLQSGEGCDDGNEVDTDECTNACALAACGDGVVRAGVEQCDDENTLSGDGCRADCLKIEQCGDGVLDEGEACDDGNDNALDRCDACALVSWTSSLLTGLGAATGVPADEVLSSPTHIAVGPNGDVFLSDSGRSRVIRLEASSGVVTVFAGTGASGFSGDGEPATNAELRGPRGVAVDGSGNVYIADSGNNRIRRVDASSGVIDTVVGNGTITSDPASGVPALEGELNSPYDIVVDGEGTLFIADYGHRRLVRVDGDTHVLTTLVETPGEAPYGLALSPYGYLYSGHRDGGTITLRQTESSSGLSQQVFLAPPYDAAQAIDLAWGADDRLYASFLVSDWPRESEVVAIDVLVDNAALRLAGGGASYDDGLALDARLVLSWGIAFDGAGGLLIVDQDESRVRHLDGAGQLTTVMGRVGRTFGDDGAALSARLLSADSVAVDNAGNVVVVDAYNLSLRMVDAATGTVRTIAGSGRTTTVLEEGTPASSVNINPLHVAWDGGRYVYYLDNDVLSSVMRVDLVADAVEHVAGDPARAGTFAGDGGPAQDAGFNGLRAIALGPDGSIYVADTTNHRIRRIDVENDLVTTYAGDGATTPLDDGELATNASLYYPWGVAVDTDGTVYIADSYNYRVRAIDPSSKIITTVAGNGAGAGSVVDGSAAVAIPMPFALAAGPPGAVYIRFNTEGTLIKLAGGNLAHVTGGDGNTQAGDGGYATAGSLAQAEEADVDDAGNLYVAELGEQPECSGLCVAVLGGARIRRIGTDGTLTSVMGAVDPPDLGPIARASLQRPSQLVALAAGERWLVAGGTSERAYLVDRAAGHVSAVVGYPRGFEPGEDPFETAPRVRARFAPLLEDASGIAFDAAAAVVYLAERDRHVIWKLDIAASDPAAWAVEPWLGVDGQAGHLDGPFVEGSGARPLFERPAGLFFDDGERALYLADAGNQVVRRIDVEGETVATVAGTPNARGFAGDGGAATAALLDEPEAIARGADGSLYVADRGNHRVRRVDASGTIETVLGDGTRSSAGEGTPAALFPVDSPRGVALDGHGNLYVTSGVAVRQVLAGADGVAAGDDEVRTLYGAAPRASFPESATRCLSGVHVEDTASGPHVLVLDACLGFLLELTPATE